MEVGLLEGVKGCFLSGIRIEELPREQRIVQSVIDHLSLLFNERAVENVKNSPDVEEDSIIANSANPEYGLPDMSEIYIEPSKAKRVENLRLAIKKAVVEFESRLKNIEVTYEEIPPTSYRLTFLLSADIVAQESIQFETTFSLADPATVERKEANPKL